MLSHCFLDQFGQWLLYERSSFVLMALVVRASEARYKMPTSEFLSLFVLEMTKSKLKFIVQEPGLYIIIILNYYYILIKKILSIIYLSTYLSICHHHLSWTYYVECTMPHTFLVMENPHRKLRATSIITVLVWYCSRELWIKMKEQVPSFSVINLRQWSVL